MRLRKRTKLAGALGGLLLLVQVGTYWLLAGRSMPVAGLRALHDRVLLRGKQFALVPQETWDALSQSQRDALTCELKSRFAVIYHSEDEVPLASLYTQSTTEQDIKQYEEWKREGYVLPSAIEQRKRAIERGYHITGYRDGVRLGWQAVWRVPFAMRSKASSWVSGTGAEWREDVYVWLFGWWVRVWNTRHAMA